MSPIFNLFVREPRSENVLSLVNHTSTLLKKLDMECVLNILVRGTYFGNNEVHKDDTSQEGSEEVDKPVEVILVDLDKISLSIEVEVTNWHSHHVKDSHENLVQQHVLFVRTSSSVLDLSGAWVITEFVLTPVNDTKDKSKDEEDDDVEDEEWTKIDEYLLKHRHKTWESLEYSQEEEGLDHQDKGDDNHDVGIYNTQDVWVESLQEHICKTDPDMSLINEIPRVLEIFYKSSLVSLHAIVEHWVQETHEHQPAKSNPVVILLVQVNSVDIDTVNDEVDKMNERSHVVNMLGKLVPHEVVEIVYNFGIEDAQFLGFSEFVQKITHTVVLLTIVGACW
jgi:hypothetical protein